MHVLWSNSKLEVGSQVLILKVSGKIYPFISIWRPLH